jgi:sulfide:quinone oxidoreductase
VTKIDEYARALGELEDPEPCWCSRCATPGSRPGRVGEGEIAHSPIGEQPAAGFYGPAVRRGPDVAAHGHLYGGGMTGEERTRILVAGGGVAGIETVLALQALAGDRVALDLLAPDRHFAHRPLSVTEPFRPERPQRIPLAAIAADRGVVLHRDALAQVDTDARLVETQDRARLEYDVLVLALGARPVEAVPGALTFRGSRDAHRVRELVDALREGSIRRLAFVAPAGTAWALPIYELALQTAHAVPGVDLHLVTHEPAPLATFGPTASAEIAQLLAERGITVHASTAAAEYAAGRLHFASGASLDADRVIALPHLAGPYLRGVPSDALGFVPVDEFTSVLDVAAVHAVGDIAARDLKQGGLAAQQADVAAQVIAAAAGANVVPRPYQPVLRGMLLTGSEVRYLRHEPSGTSNASDEALWWPPHKVAGRHLAHYLASHTEFGRPTVPGAPRLAVP